MLRKLEKRASYRAAHEFYMITHDVAHDMRKILPASSWRLSKAAIQIMHFIIHSDGKLKHRRGQWRIRHAIAAAYVAQRKLQRLYRVEGYRVQVSACLEVVERLIPLLEAERSEAA